MLNPFYWYSIIWTFVLALYGLGYSEINQPLSTDLLFFLIFTIILTGFVGFLFRDTFKYHALKKKPKVTNILTIVIVIFVVIDVVYTKQIPFLAILKGAGKYGDKEMMGMPLVHTVLTNLIIVYSSYLFYIFLETKDKNILAKILLQLSFFLLFFQKGMIIIALFIFFNLMIAKLKIHNQIFTLKNIILILISVLVLLYLNGILANLRSGMMWNDNSYITTVARINNWPKWIPGQYIWSYTYVTTPLGNLNQLLSVYDGQFSFGKVLLTCVPSIISNQLIPSNNIFNDLDTKLTVKYLNASSGFMDALNAGGIFGIIIFYIMIMIITTLIVWYISKNKKWATPSFALFSMMIVWCFFYDTFDAAATSLIPILLILFRSLKKYNIKYN